MKCSVYSVVVGALLGQSVAAFVPIPKQTMVSSNDVEHVVQTPKNPLMLVPKESFMTLTCL